MRDKWITGKTLGAKKKEFDWRYDVDKGIMISRSFSNNIVVYNDNEIEAILRFVDNERTVRLANNVSKLRSKTEIIGLGSFVHNYLNRSINESQAVSQLVSILVNSGVLEYNNKLSKMLFWVKNSAWKSCLSDFVDQQINRNKIRYLLEISDYRYIQDRFYENEEDYYSFMSFYVVHEIFHCLVQEYGNNIDMDSIDLIKEEHLANAFCVAFWRLYGDKKYLQQVYEQVSDKLLKVRHELMVRCDSFIYESITRNYMEFYQNNSYISTIFNTLVVCQSDSDLHYRNFQLCSLLDAFNSSSNINNILQLVNGSLQLVKKPLTTIEFKAGVDTPQKILDFVEQIFIDNSLNIPHIEYCVMHSDGYCQVRRAVQPRFYGL